MTETRSRQPFAPDDGAARLGKTCCVISDKSFYLVDGEYCSAGGFNKHMEVLRALFDRVIIAVPVSHGSCPSNAYPLSPDIAEVVELPTYRYKYPFQSLLHPIGLGRPMLNAIQQADVVHVMMPGYPQLLGLLIAQMQGKPLFCSLVGDWEANFVVCRFAESHPCLVTQVIRIHRVLLRWILKSGLVFAYGRSMTQSYRRIGTNVVESHGSTFSKSSICSPEDLSGLHKPPRLLFVGRLDYKKGIPVLLRAMARLRDAGLVTTLTIVGNGPSRQEFLDLVEKLALQGVTRFRGHVRTRDDLWAIYREHDLFVLPSLTEGAPTVVNEAYANGLPVVATNVGGIPGMVSTENGILVRPNDADALAGAIRRTLTDDDLRQRFAQHNLRAARTKTMEVQVRHMAKHIRRSLPNIFRS
jgi:glycosyltransferase involved in cell wall biosynthesis